MNIKTSISKPSTVVYWVVTLSNNFLMRYGKSSKSLVRNKLWIFWTASLILDMTIPGESVYLEKSSISYQIEQRISPWQMIFIVHQVLNSLSIEYEQLQKSYSTLRDNETKMNWFRFSFKKRKAWVVKAMKELMIVLAPSNTGNNHNKKFKL